MRHLALFSLMVASLAAAAGCGASSRASQHSAVPTGAAVASLASDPSFCPPTDMDISYGAGDEMRAGARPPSAASTEMKPNTSERPVRGAVHAAIY